MYMIDEKELEELRRENAAMRDRIEALEKFKAYVHHRLDDAGIEKDPESPHKVEGCRIGGRLDIVLGRIAGVEVPN